jgi:hypothetical protein
VTPFLLESEVAALTMPLRQPAAQKRFLKKIGVPFVSGADGRPLISRDAVAERLALGGGATAAQIVVAASQGPNREALMARFASRKKKGAKNGSTAKVSAQERAVLLHPRSG